MKNKLMEQLPFFYEGCKEVNSIQSSFEFERKQLEINVIDLINNLFVSSATSWGLALWEEMLGLKVNNNMDLELRKSNILAKIKSNTVCTLDALKSVCESYTNATVEVVEDNKNYRFNITFVDGGISNSKELIKKINDMKPAHLDYEIISSIANNIRVMTSKLAIKQEYIKLGTMKCSSKLKTTKNEVVEC